jgi:transposase
LAVKGETTLHELCKIYNDKPRKVLACKKQLFEHGSALLNKADKAASNKVEQEKLQSTLYEKIGQLTVERDYLKKCWSKLHESSGGS